MYVIQILSQNIHCIFLYIYLTLLIIKWSRGQGSGDRMVVGFTTSCAISAYHPISFEFEPRSWRGVLDTTLCDKVRQWLATGQWFSPVYSTNKTEPPRYNCNIIESGVKHHKPIKWLITRTLQNYTFYKNYNYKKKNNNKESIKNTSFNIFALEK